MRRMRMTMRMTMIMMVIMMVVMMCFSANNVLDPEVDKVFPLIGRERQRERQREGGVCVREFACDR